MKTSLGEFEQARPLIEALLEKSPGTKILVSFFSPSGYTVRENYDPRVAVVYLPFDSRKNVIRFLELAKPATAVFIKYEFWGNFLSELNRRGIETYIISSVCQLSFESLYRGILWVLINPICSKTSVALAIIFLSLPIKAAIV